MLRRQRARRMREDGEPRKIEIINGRRRLRGPVGMGGGGGPVAPDHIILGDGFNLLQGDGISLILLG